MLSVRTRHGFQVLGQLLRLFFWVSFCIWDLGFGSVVWNSGSWVCRLVSKA